MNVLHVLNHSVPYIHGYSSRSKYIVDHQRRLNLNPIVITSARHTLSSFTEEVIDGTTYYRTHTFDSLTDQLIMKLPILREYSLMRRLRSRILEILSRHPIDIIHAHSPFLCGIPAMQAAREMNIPFVYEVRSPWEEAAVNLKKFGTKSLRYKMARLVEKRLLEKVDQVVCICQGLREDFMRRGIDETKIDIVGNGVEPEKFVPRPKDTALLSQLDLDRQVVFGFIGSFYPGEGLDLLIEAWPQIHQTDPKTCLLIVGGGPEQERLQDMAREINGHTNSIHFTGRIPHEEILSYYSIVDVFVYPRRKIRLNEIVTPLKPLEAMAMEKIVVASDVGGLRELIDDKQTGFLYSADDIGALIECCKAVLSKKVLTDGIGKSARNYVKRCRSWQDIVKGYLDIYASLKS